MGNCAGKPKTKEPVVSNKIQTPSKPAQETVVKQTPVKPAVKASENFPAKPKEDEKQIAAARGPRPDITVEAKKPNVQTVKFASCTTSGICSDVSEMCSAQVENIATKATVEIVPETVTEKLESFADDIAATEQIQKTSVADSFDEEQENYSNLKTGIDNVLQTDDFNDFIDTFTDKSKDIDVNVQTCSGAQESEITADFCEETLIKPIQRELSQDLEGSRIEGKTLSDYKASLAETKTDIEDFCGDIAVKTEEKLFKTSDFIQVENESSDFIQEDIIQPVMRQHSLETNQIEGKTLADYKASMNAVKDEFHEDFAETIEEIRKSQEMLDQLCSDMLPKKSDEVFEIPDKISREESTTNSNDIVWDTPKDVGMSLFEKRRLLCDDYTMENIPRDEKPDRQQADMFKMRQQYANWADGVDQNISQKFISSAQNEDELAKEKMAKRYEEMERRGQMGQKLAKDRKPSEGQVYNFKTSSDSLNRTNARPTNPDYDPDRVDTDLLRSEEKTFSKRQLIDKQSGKRLEYNQYAALKNFSEDRSAFSPIEEQDACVHEQIESFNQAGESESGEFADDYMSKITYELDLGQFPAEPKKEKLSPTTIAKRQEQFKGNKPVGVDLKRKVNDEFQEFMDFVSECSMDTDDTKSEEFRPDPEKEDLFARKIEKANHGQQNSGPKHFGEIVNFPDAPKVVRPERKIGNQSYKELAALPPKKQF